MTDAVIVCPKCGESVCGYSVLDGEYRHYYRVRAGHYGLGQPCGSGVAAAPVSEGRP